MDKKITIAVHGGIFHADDIFAVAVLQILLGGEVIISVVRTRNEEIIKNADYVVDVGQIYDESANRFDHHQSNGAGKRENTIPYASFGLVWKKFGENLCGSKKIAEKIDQLLVQPIDAIDNGVAIIKSLFDGLYPYNVYDFFDALLPTWKEKNENVDEIFMRAVSYAKIILEREIKQAKDKEEAGKIVIDEYNKTADKRIIVLNEFYPAGEFLSNFPEPLFVVFPKENGEWVVKAVRDDANLFINRKDLPENWAGKSGVELEKATGVDGSVFCHSGRFLVVAKTKEIAIKLAQMALN